MYRRTIQIAIILATVMLWLGGTPTAFTLRLGPVPVSDVPAAAPSTAGADIPTPQFFRVVIGRGGVILDVMPASARDTSSEPDVHFQDMRASHPADVRVSQQVRTTTTPPRLRGVELLLLRQTYVSAQRRDE